MTKRDRVGVFIGLMMLGIFFMSIFIIVTHPVSSSDPCAHEYTQMHAPGAGIRDVDLQWFAEHCSDYTPAK